MKKHVIELLKKEDSWGGYSWHPREMFSLNIDDMVMEWAQENNAFVYKHYVQSGEYIYEPKKICQASII